jgi:hypothetical protein
VKAAGPTGSAASPVKAAGPTGSARPGGPADAHEWVSFEDPEEYRLWVFDVTFLLSGWECIFARGCQGVLTGPAPELVQGCCSYGAHFTDDADVARVKRAARRLRAADWQYHREGRRDGVVDTAADGTRTTRLVDDACVFLNRPGFPAGPGCALHQAALRDGRPPLETKPDVCWQLPLRREDRTEEDGRVVTTVSQWERRHWGAGGEEFHWWCTEAPEAFGGRKPVYKAMAAELRELVGDGVYQRLAAYLDSRRKGATVPLAHPAVRLKGGAP